MSTTGRTDIVSGHLVGDLNCDGYKIIGLPSSSALLNIAKTIYVDGTNGSSNGQRGTTNSFQNINQAQAVAQSGDFIVIQPGTYLPSSSSPITFTIPVTIIGNNATIKANSPNDTVLQFNSGSSGSVVNGITFDGSRSGTTPGTASTLYIHGVNNISIKNCSFIHSQFGGIAVDLTSDNILITGCYFSDNFRDVQTPSLNTTIVSRLKITGNTFAGNYSGANGSAAIKLNSQASAFYSGTIVSDNNITGPGQEGIEFQGSWTDINVSTNTIKDMTDTGISVDGPITANIIGNNIKGCLVRGIEFVHPTDYNADGNVIDGKNDAGTPTTVQGYSISNGYTSNIVGKINIAGGQVVDCHDHQILIYRTDDIRINNVYVRIPNIASCNGFYAQMQQGLAISKCIIDNNLTNANVFYTEGSNTVYATPSGFHFRDNRINNYSGGQLSQICLFYTGDSCAFNDVVFEGNTTNVTFCGSGFIEVRSPATAPGLIEQNNLPVSPVTTNNQFGFQDTSNLYSVKLGNHSSLSVASPLTIDMGGTYSNTAGANSKLQVFNDGLGNIFGFGVNSTALDYIVPTGTKHDFWISGTKYWSLSPNVITNGTITWTKGSGSPEGVVTAPVGSFFTRTDGGTSTTFYVKTSGSGNTGWTASVSAVGGGATIATTSAVLKGDGAGNAIASTPTGTGDNVLATSPTLITPTIGVATATSVNKWTLTAPSTAATLTAGADNKTYTLPEITTLIGARHIPQNSQSASYTTVLTDSGGEVHHPASDNNARTFTIDSNANVAYPIGTVILFTNMAAANLTIAITSDTMYLAGAGTTGSRTVAQYGSMVARKIGTTSWYAIPIAGTT